MKKQKGTFTIQPPRFETIEVRIQGTAPLMVSRFSQKARQQIEAKQTGPNQVKRKRPPKDYVAEFQASRYIAREGWDGFYAGSIRAALINALRFVDGLPMTTAKGLFFIEADGLDREDGTPLVRIYGSKVQHDTRPAINADGGADMRNRARYDVPWYAIVRIRFDADQVSASDTLNLLARAGIQIGLCEGRPFSKDSFGIGFGTFEVKPARASVRRLEAKRTERRAA